MAASSIGNGKNGEIIPFTEQWRITQKGSNGKTKPCLRNEDSTVLVSYTPNPMKFLNKLLGRPASEKPIMIIAAGHPHHDAMVPAIAKQKNPLKEIMTVEMDR